MGNRRGAALGAQPKARPRLLPAAPPAARPAPWPGRAALPPLPCQGCTSTTPTPTPAAPQLLELVASELSHAPSVDPEVSAFWEATKRHIAHQKALEAAGGGEGGRYSALVAPGP